MNTIKKTNIYIKILIFVLISIIIFEGFSVFKTNTLTTMAETLNYIPGDINGDSFVNSEDLILIKKEGLLHGNYCKSMEVNGDGKINILDLVQLKKYLVNGSPNLHKCLENSDTEKWPIHFEQIQMPPVDGVNWKMTFNDNFDYLDLQTWKLREFENHDYKNHVRRCAYYVDDGQNVFTENGKLHIRTNYRDGIMGKGWYSGFLTTGKNTSKKDNSPNFKGFNINHGYIECRCKPAKAEGIWSAFWMMPDDNFCFSDDDIQGTATDGMEIDIMESHYSFKPDKYSQEMMKHAMHTDGEDERIKSLVSPKISVPDMYDEFHTYGLYWGKNKYIFFIDGKKTWETKFIHEGKDYGICNVPEFLKLTTEVAGCIDSDGQHPGLIHSDNNQLIKFWAGNPNNNDMEKNYDFIVDYVRCFEEVD